jgi:hypothetical protein
MQEEQRKKTVQLQQTCWFCGAAPPSEEKKHWANMHLEKVIRATANWRTSRVMDIPVPRCERCYRIHRRAKWINGAGLTCLFGPIVIEVTEISGSGFVNVMPYLMYFGIACLTLGNLLYHITFPKDTRRKIAAHHYPLVEDTKSQGYRAFWGRLFHS